METPQPARGNRRLLILAAIIVAFVCVCVIMVGVAIYSWSAIRGVQTEDSPLEETTPVITQGVTPASDEDSPTDVPGADSGIGEAPAGGLGNDILRNDTWQSVAAAAEGQGCDQPVAEESTIEVLQEPDADGVWVEQWTVACAAGDAYSYEVEYIPDDTGATFNIQSIR